MISSIWFSDSNDLHIFCYAYFNSKTILLVSGQKFSQILRQLYVQRCRIFDVSYCVDFLFPWKFRTKSFQIIEHNIKSCKNHENHITGQTIATSTAWLFQDDVVCEVPTTWYLPDDLESIYTYTHIHIHIYMYIYIHICTYIYLRAWPRAGPWALGRCRAWVCTYMYVYVHVYVYMYMCIWVYRL